MHPIFRKIFLQYFHGIPTALFFFMGNYIVFPAQAEYSYFSACIFKNVLLDAVELILEPDCK